MEAIPRAHIDIHGLSGSDGYMVEQSIIKMLSGAEYKKYVVFRRTSHEHIYDLNRNFCPHLRIYANNKDIATDIIARLAPLNMGIEYLYIDYTPPPASNTNIRCT